MHKQSANLVPEVTPEHEQAGQQKQVAAQGIGQRITGEAWNDPGGIDSQPAKHNGGTKHHQTDLVAQPVVLVVALITCSDFSFYKKGCHFAMPSRRRII